MRRLLSALAALALPGTSAAADRPNLVVLIADDLGYGELSCQGGDIATPHIDSLAADGARFTAGYVTAPFCAASRAGLLTGRWQTRFGFEFNPIGARNMDPAIGLPPAERTLADSLRDAGYATALVGKWHLGATAAYHPQRRGFDEFFGFLHEGHFYRPPPWSGTVTWLRRRALPDGSQGRWTSPDGRIIWSTHLGSNEPDYDADNPLLRLSQPVAEPENLTTAFSREACSFIERHASQPFFLCLAFNAVHSPLQADDRYLERFSHIEDVQRRLFAAMLTHLDDGVGRVLNTLDETSLRANTCVVFLSDNGGPTAELTSSNAPLRGGKAELWEGGIRVPFLIRWPAQIPAGQVLDTPILSTDIAATARRWIRESDADRKIQRDGLDLLPLLRDGTPLAERPLYWRVGKKAALRRGPWKISRAAGKGSSQAWALYNLEKDPAETTDVSSSEPALFTQMIDEWQRIDSQMIEPAW
ncbi:MAG: sulfatase-like hydrolase/transferase [Verrucomicrobiales bacterium]|nr:sulfatase-like hydrolase/transferase [Verrucomicrobiales bacterium]